MNKYLLHILLFTASWLFSITNCAAQDDSIKAIVLINGRAHLVDVMPNGDITTVYQEITNYFASSESHTSIMRRLIPGARSESGNIVFYEKEAEPIPSFTEENRRPVEIGNEQYIGFSPGKALLLKPAVDQIRKIANAYKASDIKTISIASFYRDNYRSRSLARNRAQAITDLLVAFGVRKTVISSNQFEALQDTKVDFVQLSFGQ